MLHVVLQEMGYVSIQQLKVLEDILNTTAVQPWNLGSLNEDTDAKIAMRHVCSISLDVLH